MEKTQTTEPEARPGTEPVPLSGPTRAALLFALMTLGIGMSMMFAVVPPLGREAGLSELETGLVLAISALFYAVTTPFWARLAERVGRKKVMVFSLMAAGLSNLAFAWVINAALQGLIATGMIFFTFTAVRLSFGLLTPGFHPASMAMVAESSTAKARAAALGALGAAMGVGAILGPALATVLTPLGAVAPIRGAGALSLTAALVVIVLVREQRPVASEDVARPALPLFHPSIAPLMVLLAVYFVGLAGFQQTFAFMLQDTLALDTIKAAQLAGIGFMVISVASLATQFGYVSVRKPPPRTMLRWGLGLVAAGYLGAAFAPEFWILCVCLFLMGTGGALAVPGANAMGSIRAPDGYQGAAVGLMASAPPTGFVAGPVLGAWLYQIDPHLPLLSAGGAVALLAVASLKLKSTMPGGDPLDGGPIQRVSNHGRSWSGRISRPFAGGGRPGEAWDLGGLQAAKSFDGKHFDGKRGDQGWDRTRSTGEAQTTPSAKTGTEPQPVTSPSPRPDPKPKLPV